MPHDHALIIEDNSDSIDVLGRMLGMEGLTYTAINDPAELQPEQLDGVSVIFLDLDMPNMNGYEMFGLLKKTYGVQVPIVAYTVNTNEKATTRSMGFDGMFAKPLNGICFGDHLQRLLSGEKIWDDC